MNCASCGAPVELEQERGLLICRHCGCQSPLPAQADSPRDANDELAQVERWWERESRRFMRLDRHGNQHPPEEQHISHVMLMVAGGVLGLFSAFIGHQWDQKLLGMAGFFLFPLLLTLPAALLHQRAENRYKAFQKLEAEYRGRRNAVLESRAARRH